MTSAFLVFLPSVDPAVRIMKNAASSTSAIKERPDREDKTGPCDEHIKADESVITRRPVQFVPGSFMSKTFRAACLSA